MEVCIDGWKDRSMGGGLAVWMGDVWMNGGIWGDGWVWVDGSLGE